MFSSQPQSPFQTSEAEAVQNPWEQPTWLGVQGFQVALPQLSTPCTWEGQLCKERQIIQLKTPYLGCQSCCHC